MSRFRHAAALAASALFAALVVAGPATAQKVVKLSLIVPLDSTQGQAAERFKEIAEERSGGSLEVRIFPSNQLGEIYQVIDSLTAGSVEMLLVSYDTYARYSPALKLLGMSFIMRDRDHAFAVYDSDLHARIVDEILESTRIRVLATNWTQGPYKIVLSKSPVLQPDDLRGVPMRVPAQDIDILVWGEGTGANVRPVPWPEAPLALRQGLVEAIELPADFVRPFRFYESAKYLMLSRHRWQIVYAAISESFWQTLDESERSALAEAAQEAGDWYTEAVEHAWLADQDYLKSQGVVIVDFDTTPWHERIVELARELETKGEWEAGLVDELISYAR